MKDPDPTHQPPPAVVFVQPVRMPLVGVIMSSASYWQTRQHTAGMLTALGIVHEVRVVSDHLGLTNSRRGSL